MLEISDPARSTMRDALRRGQVLVLEAPWGQYRPAIGLVGTWRQADDARGLGGYVRVGYGEYLWIRPELLPVLRRRRLRLERHTVLGLWPGIAVRDLDPSPLLVDERPGLWPRLVTPGDGPFADE